MAIYHFSVKTISRSAGRSAVAAAAYRAGVKLLDEKYGKEQDYTKKSGVELAQIYAPDFTATNLLDRQKLWNAVERAESRKDSVVAREFEVAFPHELNKEQRKQMLDELCQLIVKKHSVIVDAAIHAPHRKSGSDERNYHAHILFTPRAVAAATGEFEAKKYRDFNIEKSRDSVKHWRETFADIANRHLLNAGHAITIDHRSNRSRQIKDEATIHEGPSVTHQRRKGIDTDISVENDERKARNIERQQAPALLAELTQQIVLNENSIAQYQNELSIERAHALEKALEQAEVRAKAFHSEYQKFASNFPTGAHIVDQSKHAQKHDAYNLANQYLKDFELLKNNNREPKPVKPSLMQKIAGKTAYPFYTYEMIRHDVRDEDGFFITHFMEIKEHNSAAAKKKADKQRAAEQQSKVDAENSKIYAQKRQIENAITSKRTDLLNQSKFLNLTATLEYKNKFEIAAFIAEAIIRNDIHASKELFTYNSRDFMSYLYDSKDFEPSLKEYSETWFERVHEQYDLIIALLSENNVNETTNSLLNDLQKKHDEFGAGEKLHNQQRIERKRSEERFNNLSYNDQQYYLNYDKNAKSQPAQKDNTRDNSNDLDM